jgi:hypothetical protein
MAGLDFQARVFDLVKEDLANRNREGWETYGKDLFTTDNDRDSLWDLYEELLDACVYIRKVIWERDNGLVTARHLTNPER